MTVRQIGDTPDASIAINERNEVERPGPASAPTPTSAPPPPPVSESRFRSDIEGIRGIAVLLVVLFHARIPGFSGGFVGVDVFFVLSGYLITGLLVSEVERKGTLSFTSFYARRIRRLLPASALVTLGVLGASWLLLSPVDTVLVSRAARATALYITNIWFMQQAGDYFSPNVEGNPLLHMWSLAVEEQFYLVWPLLILVARRATVSRRGVVVTMGVVTLVSLAASVVLTAGNQTLAFYAPHARAWEFAIGGLAAMLPASQFRTWGSQRWRMLSWFGIALIVGAAVSYSASTTFPGLTALPLAVGTSLMLMAWDRGGALAWLNSRALQLTGRLSYSWYLLHWPFLVIGAALIPGLSMSGRIACALASFAVAAAMNAGFENPIRFSPTLARVPVRSLAIGAALTLGVAALATLSRRQSLIAQASPVQRSFARVSHDVSPLVQSGCVQQWQTEGVKRCIAGDSSSSRVLVLFGDSHAGQWSATFDHIAKRNGFRLVTFLRSGCPAAYVTVQQVAMRRTYVECDRWRENVFTEIAQLKPEMVVVASFAGYVRDVGLSEEKASVTAAQWGEGQSRTVERLRANGASVVVLRDPPYPGNDVPHCLSRASWRGADLARTCNVARSLALSEPLAAVERAAVSKTPGSRYVDLSDVFCSRTECPVFLNGNILYKDTDHLTASFVTSLEGRVERELLRDARH